ncbi:MAG: hypothetical protein J6I66_01420 [Lachnospiraceae bacterium]|nr:hypothetical protein [Lachnospiraceae bacterium]
MKRILAGIFVFALLLGLAGCGRIKTASELLKAAERAHGDCELVSKEETDEHTVIIVRDKLQGFEYRMSSSMSDLNIDGSNFGSFPNTYDGFDRALGDYVIDSTRAEINEYISTTGAVVQDTSLDFFMVRSNDEKEAVEAALKCAEILQEYNLDHRMDGWLIVAYANEKDDYLYDVRYGSVKLPDITWRTVETETIEYYMEMAEMQLETDVTFDRKVEGTFSDTGAELEHVVNSYYDEENIIDSSSSPVTFYYFTTQKGEKYYICDFLYEDENYDYEWFIRKADQ